MLLGLMEVGWIGKYKVTGYIGGDEPYRLFNVRTGLIFRKHYMAKILDVEVPEIAQRMIEGAELLNGLDEGVQFSFLSLVDHGTTTFYLPGGFRPMKMREGSFLVMEPTEKVLCEVIAHENDIRDSFGKIRTLIGAEPMSPDAKLRVYWDLASTLNKLQPYGIAVNDINPWTVFYSNAGAAKLGDLSRATTFTDTTSPEAQQLPSTIGIRQAYLAPEVLEGHSSATSDVYSIAAVMYSLYTGEPPFQGELRSAKACARGGAYIPLEKVCKDLPKIIYPLIKESLAGQADSRPNPEKVLAALRTVTKLG